MTQEERELLLKDLCARLRYGVICKVNFKDSEGRKTLDMTLSGIIDNDAYFTSKEGSIYSYDFKPYLRPMSSMTHDEDVEYMDVLKDGHYGRPSQKCASVVDWLNEHHFDYRGLIEKCLALEAPEDMYK